MRRLLALAAIYEGRPRSDAAQLGGVGLQAVRDWVLRFNAAGPDRLIDVERWLGLSAQARGFDKWMAGG